MIVHTRAEENDAVGHQPRKDVHLAEGHRTLLNDGSGHVLRTRNWTLRGGDVIFNGVAAHAVVMHGVLEEFFSVVHGVILEAKLHCAKLHPEAFIPGCSQPLG